MWLWNHVQTYRLRPCLSLDEICSFFAEWKGSCLQGSVTQKISKGAGCTYACFCRVREWARQKRAASILMKIRCRSKDELVMKIIYFLKCLLLLLQSTDVATEAWGLCCLSWQSGTDQALKIKAYYFFSNYCTNFLAFLPHEGIKTFFKEKKHNLLQAWDMSLPITQQIISSYPKPDVYDADSWACTKTCTPDPRSAASLL